MQRLKSLLRIFLAAALGTSLMACSTANSDAPALDGSGRHPATWVDDHQRAFLDGPSPCYQCHGTDLKGGIGKVSCFSSVFNGVACHPDGPSRHPAGWASPDSHGAAAKAPASGSNGMINCRKCHAADFTGGFVAKNCLNNAGCHGAGVNAPHPPRPWFSRFGGRTHTTTDPSNGPACGGCHGGGANSSRQPSFPAPAGTAAGCFNNTLCHGVEGHPDGWSNPDQHGEAAKKAASGSTGLAFCQSCHDEDFTGGVAEQSCLSNASCHGAGVNAPHPQKPWFSRSGRTHSTTETGNAPVCAQCHTGGANSSRKPSPLDRAGATGCFNATMCHGLEGHVAGWAAAPLHGAEAKKAPNGLTGFASCQLCHGPGFTGGSAGVSCLNTAGCHGQGTGTPHPAFPWFSRSGGVTHSTTDKNNAGICAICHTNGANSRLKPPFTTVGPADCFNNTLCHFHAVGAIPSFREPGQHGILAKQDLTICQSCHGRPGTTAFEGGVATLACPTCHPAAKAHPTDWQGAGAFSHRTAGKIGDACILCHDVSQGRSAPSSQAPSCFSSTFANALGQSRPCHAGGPGTAPHGVPFPNHNATARTNFTFCFGCHSVTTNNSLPSGRVIPRCLTCHSTSPQATPTGCTSCHGNPPNGVSYPNRDARHSVHATIACGECHNGVGSASLPTVDSSGALTHYSLAKTRGTAPVVFQAGIFTSGSALFDTVTRSCGTFTCHGEGHGANRTW